MFDDGRLDYLLPPPHPSEPHRGLPVFGRDLPSDQSIRRVGDMSFMTTGEW